MACKLFEIWQVNNFLIIHFVDPSVSGSNPDQLNQVVQEGAVPSESGTQFLAHLLAFLVESICQVQKMTKNRLIPQILLVY